MTAAIIGGVLIGLAACWLMLSLGRIAGISGIAARALMRPREAAWPLMFVVGLGIGGLIGIAVSDVQIVRGPVAAAPLIAGGLLVGFGTRLGSGCTSGHGVCGMSRLSVRSIAATCTFLLIGMVTATMVHAS